MRFLDYLSNNSTESCEQDEVELVPRCSFCGVEHLDGECFNDDKIEEHEETHQMDANVRVIVSD